VDKHAVQNFFKAEDIKNCMKKVKTVNLHEVCWVDDELQIKAYYAGHVLGAAMFEIRVGQQSVVYTVSDHHQSSINCIESFNQT
jgi:integrator complex subunit 11